MDKKLNINEWAEEDRPREKMMHQGVQALTNAELLAILIGSGNRDESAVELMRRVLLSCNNDLNLLAKKGLSYLSKFKGMGMAKSTMILAALELSKRRKTNNTIKVVRSSKDAFSIFQPVLGDASVEEFWILILNQSCRVIDKCRISIGGITSTLADVRCILKETLLRNGTSIILCHNHPSGNTQPSSEDKQLTNKIAKASQVMNLHLFDHLIVAEDSYFSFADQDLL